MKICLFDPGIENNNGYPSSNLGDLIIQEAVNQELIALFKEPDIKRLSTQSFVEDLHFRKINDHSFIFVGGTNLLSSNMNKYKQWKIKFRDAIKIRNAILLGVGWWQYQTNPNLYTKLLLKIVLSRKIMHSVRDSYTKEKLNSIGIFNVLNTGCPTMWPLTQINPNEYPKSQSDNALVMLTDYNKKPELDKQLLKLILNKYKQVYFWPQGRRDYQYIIELNLPVSILENSFDSLKEFCSSGTSFDYIGTRLHGGIYCLRSRRRALILEIDNRAKEIAKDTNLQTVERDDFEKIEKWIAESPIPQIKLNCDAINQWRSQFSEKSERV